MEPPPIKIAVVVRDDLQQWQKLNLTAFVSSGVAHALPHAVGEAYVDGSGRRYLPMFASPVLVMSAAGPALARALRRALDRNLTVAVYTDDLFATMNDVDNRAAVAKVATEDLALAGISVAGDPKQVDKALDKLRLHP
jgi:hypothetical protein